MILPGIRPVCPPPLLFSHKGSESGSARAAEPVFPGHGRPVSQITFICEISEVRRIYYISFIFICHTIYAAGPYGRHTEGSHGAAGKGMQGGPPVQQGAGP